MFRNKKIQEVEVKVPTPYEDSNLYKEKYELYKEKYEKLKYNVEMLLDPELLNINKIEMGTISGDGNRDELKKMIILNLDTIVDNLCVEKLLSGNFLTFGTNHNYSMYIVVKPQDKKE